MRPHAYVIVGIYDFKQLRLQTLRKLNLSDLHHAFVAGHEGHEGYEENAEGRSTCTGHESLEQGNPCDVLRFNAHRIVRVYGCSELNL